MLNVLADDAFRFLFRISGQVSRSRLLPSCHAAHGGRPRLGRLCHPSSVSSATSKAVVSGSACLMSTVSPSLRRSTESQLACFCDRFCLSICQYMFCHSECRAVEKLLLLVLRSPVRSPSLPRLTHPCIAWIRSAVFLFSSHFSAPMFSDAFQRSRDTARAWREETA